MIKSKRILINFKLTINNKLVNLKAPSGADCHEVIKLN
jgi:hypothetical protein